MLTSLCQYKQGEQPNIIECEPMHTSTDNPMLTGVSQL